MRRERDRDYIRLMSSKQWRQLRNLTLSACPLCVRCQREGRITAATEVHHVTPIESGRTYAEKERLAYSPSNLMPLCHACHRSEHIEAGSHTKEFRLEKAKEKAAQYCRRFFGVEPPG